MVDIAEILRDFPKGTELYSPIIGYVKLFGVRNMAGKDGIRVDAESRVYWFDKYGRYDEGPECLLFPSRSNRDWSAFKKHGRFKAFERIVGRYNEDTCWRADFFSHYGNEDEDLPYQGVGGGYERCLPYNEETAQLIGTMSEYIEEP